MAAPVRKGRIGGRPSNSGARPDNPPSRLFVVALKLQARLEEGISPHVARTAIVRDVPSLLDHGVVTSDLTLCDLTPFMVLSC